MKNYYGTPYASYTHWLKRGVYLAQCATWKCANELGLCTSDVHIRVVRKYRTQSQQIARDMVALSMRMKRMKGRIAA